MPLCPSTSRRARSPRTIQVPRWIGVAAILSFMATTTPRAYEEPQPPRFQTNAPDVNPLVERVEAYGKAPPLHGFIVDSIDARFESDTTGWVRTWGRTGWAPPRSVLFRFEHGKVVEHRVDSQLTCANDRKLSRLKSMVDSCENRRAAMRQAEAESLATEYENFAGVTIGKTGLDSIDGLGGPMETRILEKGRIGVLVDSGHAPRHVTLIDAWKGRVVARLVGHREMAEERCPSYDDGPADSTGFPVAVYAPEKSVSEILVALRGKPAVSNLRIFRDDPTRARSEFRFAPQGRFDHYLWADIWYGDDLVAKLEGDSYWGSSFKNTYEFAFQGRTIHGYKATISHGEVFGWLFRTELGWREVFRSNAVVPCYD